MKNIIRVLILLVFSISANLLYAKTIYVYNWTEYIPSSVIEQFTKETGINVSYSTYQSNEEMYAKIKLINSNSGNSGFDFSF